MSGDAELRALDGWAESAHAYIDFQDNGDPNRTLLLDPVMLRLCGDVAGAHVLDVGCGEGRFCRMLAAEGARCIGIDPIDVMARTAQARGAMTPVRASADALPFASTSFDVVVTYITLVDIEHYREAIAEMARVLRSGGRLVAANLGFVTASYGWEKEHDGTRLYHRVDRYAEEWSQVYDWLGIRIRNWHRPLANYMSAYLRAGLTLRQFLEPVPQDESLREQYYFEDWFRVPLFNVMRWDKLS